LLASFIYLATVPGVKLVIGLCFKDDCGEGDCGEGDLRAPVFLLQQLNNPFAIFLCLYRLFLRIFF